MAVPMWTLIVKNNGSNDKLFEDLGISVPASGSIEFSEFFGFEQIADSDDLRAAVASGGNIVINDGSSDLSAQDGVDFLTIEHIEDVRSEHYTKVQLGTPGEAVVDWNNVTNVPTSVSAANTLDEAYDAGGPGVGRTIFVDSGAVQLSASPSGYAPLELTDLPVAPKLGLTNFQLAPIGGLLYYYDTTRGKFLSVQRQTFVFGRRGRTRNQFLNFFAGRLPSNNSGIRIMRNATIVGLAIQLDAIGSCDARIRKNDQTTNIATLNVSSAIGATDITVNVDLDADDYLQSFLNAPVGGVFDPVFIVEIAWRQL